MAKRKNQIPADVVAGAVGLAERQRVKDAEAAARRKLEAEAAEARQKEAIEEAAARWAKAMRRTFKGILTHKQRTRFLTEAAKRDERDADASAG